MYLIFFDQYSDKEFLIKSSKYVTISSLTCKHGGGCMSFLAFPFSLYV